MIGAAKFEVDDAKRSKVAGSVRGEARHSTAVKAVQRAAGVAGTIGRRPGTRHTPQRASLLPRGSPPNLFDDRWRVVAALKSSVRASHDATSPKSAGLLQPARSGAGHDEGGTSQRPPPQEVQEKRGAIHRFHPHRQDSASDTTFPPRIGAARQPAADRGGRRPSHAVKTAGAPGTKANGALSSIVDRSKTSDSRRSQQQNRAASTGRASLLAGRAPPQHRHDAEANTTAAAAKAQPRDAVEVVESPTTPDRQRGVSSAGKQHVITDFPFAITPSKQHVVSFAGSGGAVDVGGRVGQVPLSQSQTGLEARKFLTSVDQLRSCLPVRLAPHALPRGRSNAEDYDGDEWDDYDDGYDYDNGGASDGLDGLRRRVGMLSSSKSLPATRSRSFSPVKRPSAATSGSTRQNTSAGRARSSSPKKKSMNRRWRADHKAARSPSKAPWKQPSSWMFANARQKPALGQASKGGSDVDGAVVNAIVDALKQAGVASPVLTRQVAAAVSSRIMPSRGRGQPTMPPTNATSEGIGGFGRWDGDSALAPQADVLPESKLAPDRCDIQPVAQVPRRLLRSEPRNLFSQCKRCSRRRGEGRREPVRERHRLPHHSGAFARHCWVTARARRLLCVPIAGKDAGSWLGKRVPFTRGKHSVGRCVSAPYIFFTIEHRRL